MEVKETVTGGVEEVWGKAVKRGEKTVKDKFYH